MSLPQVDNIGLTEWGMISGLGNFLLGRISLEGREGSVGGIQHSGLRSRMEDSGI